MTQAQQPGRGPITFDGVLEAIKPYPKRRVAVAVAADDAALDAVARAARDNVADAVPGVGRRNDLRG